MAPCYLYILCSIHQNVVTYVILLVPQVESLGERIVLYILNRVIYRAKEMSCEELPFLCHGDTDYAKILWDDGEAVGFYSVKPAGNECALVHVLVSGFQKMSSR